MADKILARRDTAATWTSVNPVLALGEIGFETDTAKLKFGDGSTAWTTLGYVAGLSDAEVRAAVEAATDSNVFTDNDHSKLDGIAAAATVDQSDAAIAAAYANVVAQASGGEITAGTESALRAHSPADIKAYVDEHSAAGAPTGIVFVTASNHTLDLTDVGKIIEMSSTNARDLIIPLNSSVAFPIGTVISITRLLTGTVQILANGSVYLNGIQGAGGFINNQYDAVSLYKRATDTWLVQGAIGGIS